MCIERKEWVKTLGGCSVNGVPNQTQVEAPIKGPANRRSFLLRMIADLIDSHDATVPPPFSQLRNQFRATGKQKVNILSPKIAIGAVFQSLLPACHLSGVNAPRAWITVRQYLGLKCQEVIFYFFYRAACRT
ncbi:hypothetical protein CDO23_06605 [Sinorhizobium meliloti]|nr:hypothetical protein CDO23_06605 [Sinorhizobium meliloti]